MFDWGQHMKNRLLNPIVNSVENLILANVSPLCGQLGDSILQFIQEEGILSNAVLGFLVGLLVALTSLLDGIYHILTFSICVSIVDAVMFVFGFVMSALHYKVTFLPTAFLTFLKMEMRFLFNIYGRSYSYLFVGGFLISRSNLKSICNIENFLVGFLVLLSSFVMIYNSYTTLHDLDKIKENIRLGKIDPQKLKVEFNKCDSDWNGRLSTTEFINFLKSLKIDLSHDDLETALLSLDRSHDNEITWKEFIAWYENQVILKHS
jgi:uncharacterized membrane protein YeaQ/YmgE (transglycosylase-associated protein family)